MQLASFDHTNLGQGLKRKTRCNDTMNVMSERGFVLAISFKGLNDDPVNYDLVYVYYLSYLAGCLPNVFHLS